MRDSKRQEMSSNDVDFERFRRTNLVGTCWWCGQPATSKEHKYKRRDLARISAGGEDLSWGAPDGRIRTLRSIRKSEGTRFKKTVCQRCNDTRSQKFDAYMISSRTTWWPTCRIFGGADRSIWKKFLARVGEALNWIPAATTLNTSDA